MFVAARFLLELVKLLDKEYLLPTKTQGYDTAGNLIGRYRYLDLRFNRGLTDKMFSPQANDSERLLV